jgi:hypothetical protein
MLLNVFDLIHVPFGAALGAPQRDDQIDSVGSITNVPECIGQDWRPSIASTKLLSTALNSAKANHKAACGNL